MDDEKLRSAFEYQQKGIRKWKNENMVKRATGVPKASGTCDLTVFLLSCLGD